MSFASYVPKLVVLSDRTMINFVGGNIVISVRETKQDVWSQYIRKADAEAISMRDKLRELASVRFG